MEAKAEMQRHRIRRVEKAVTEAEWQRDKQAEAEVGARGKDRVEAVVERPRGRGAVTEGPRGGGKVAAAGRW